MVICGKSYTSSRGSTAFKPPSVIMLLIFDVVVNILLLIRLPLLSKSEGSSSIAGTRVDQAKLIAPALVE